MREHQFTPSNGHGDQNKYLKSEDSLYNELWHACAGTSVSVPRVGEIFFYFPQGNIEQVEASTNQVADQHLPKFDLLSKILCRVINVELMANPKNDDVFAEVTLKLEQMQDENALEMETLPPPLPRVHTHSFCKTLTSSDASIKGSFFLLKRHADECLPPLDMGLEPPTQEIVAKDLHEKVWRFQHILRGNPTRHLLQHGWGRFASAKKLMAGDTFIFLRGENDEFRVGVRRAMAHHTDISSFGISSQNMYLGVLANAWQAVITGIEFKVIYNPRTCPSEFIIPYKQYMESTKIKYSIGMRFKMSFKGDESSEKRFTGTIVGIGDIDSNRWPGSEWRCLIVQWDEKSSISLPTRVSPWNIEPASTPPSSPISVSRLKRPCPIVMPSYPRSNILNKEISSPKVGESSHTYGSSRALQGQETSTFRSKFCKRNESENTKGPMTWSTLHNAKKNKSFHRSFGVDNWWQMARPDCFTKTDAPSNSHVSFSKECTLSLMPSITTDSYFNNSYSAHSQIGFEPNPSSWLTQQHNKTLKPQCSMPSQNVPTKPKRRESCKLFGVDLNTDPGEPFHVQQTIQARESCMNTSNEGTAMISSSMLGGGGSYNMYPELLKGSKLDTASVLSSDDSHWLRSPYRSRDSLTRRSSRSRIKVHKHGIARGKSVDLNKLNGYEELLAELDKIFELEGELIPPNKKWTVTYTDDEDDMMLLGDDPWEEFCNMVQHISIYTPEQVLSMNECSSILSTAEGKKYSYANDKNLQPK